MTTLTVDLSDEVASRIAPMQRWLSTILELSLLGLRTPAVATVTEIIEFLAGNPTPQEILQYHVSERAQERLQRLLALNRAGMLSEVEQLELDEMEKIEHVFIMFKASVAQQIGYNRQ